MNHLSRITFDSQVMGGKPCIRGMRVTVGMIVGLIASGQTVNDILKAYPRITAEMVRLAPAYAQAYPIPTPYLPHTGEAALAVLARSCLTLAEIVATPT